MFSRKVTQGSMALMAGLLASACSYSAGDSTRYGMASSSSGGYYDAGYGYGNGYGQASDCNAGSNYGTSSRYGGNVVSGYETYEVQTVTSTRYGTVQQGGASGGCGHWVIPTYQVVETTPSPAPVVSEPTPVVTTPAPSVTIYDDCPDGQYRMDNGQCAIMMNEEPEYVPPVYEPVTSYPTVSVPVETYLPIRK